MPGEGGGGSLGEAGKDAGAEVCAETEAGTGSETFLEARTEAGAEVRAETDAGVSAEAGIKTGGLYSIQSREKSTYLGHIP